MVQLPRTHIKSNKNKDEKRLKNVPEFMREIYSHLLNVFTTIYQQGLLPSNHIWIDIMDWQVLEKEVRTFNSQHLFCHPNYVMTHCLFLIVKIFLHVIIKFFSFAHHFFPLSPDNLLFQQQGPRSHHPLAPTSQPSIV